MIKVRCRYPWDAERDIGIMRPENINEEDFNNEQGKLFAEKNPHLRPCGKYHGVAVKKTCKRCPACIEIFEE